MPTYRLSKEQSAPGHAVLVKVWKQTGRTVADVICSHCPNAGEFLVPDVPRPVPLALKRAEEIRKICELSEIIVFVDADGLWRPEWGTLVSGEETIA